MFMASIETFERRHIGLSENATNEMLKTIGESSIDALIDKTVPSQIRLEGDLNIAEAMSESEYLEHINEQANKNQLYDSYIGLGYYNTHVPSVILRNVLENPGWYTAYTPYQAEIAQGRLEALLNFQTMVMDLTQMEIANASLLDEATAASEAMIMFYNTRSRADQKAGINKCFVSSNCFPQTIDVIVTKAKPLGIDVIVGDHEEVEITEEFFGAIVQYPGQDGEVCDFTDFISNAHNNNAKVAVGADIMSLVLLTAPGKMGADVVYGTTQRFGVPMGFGGPHAAYFATRKDYKRHIPGRIIGVSQDADGNPALRMALQTREQHIRRDKATSNICTAQALLASMASFYAVYHGPEGLRTIASNIHSNTCQLAAYLTEFGFNVLNDVFFDTLAVELPENLSVETLRILAVSQEINLRYSDTNIIGISIDETTNKNKLEKLINLFADASNNTSIELENFAGDAVISGTLERQDDILTHETFNSYHSETEMMRYLKKLENKDLSLAHSMIPLGSCTMKLNAASELIPITNPLFCNLHPFCPQDQAKGLVEVIEQLDADLSEITGFAKVSMQPNSGAQGEYAGLMVIRAYHHSRGDFERNIVLIPASAHGTNPASAVMAGMKVVVTKCDDQGNIDIEDLKAKAEKHKDNLSALMVTYPSTHGVFEETIKEVNEIIHQNGGQVYMDGANMNAQVGLTNPGNIGADVCHLNLHKTFAIPHGGGGPGVGPIGVASHLAEFLPGNVNIPSGGENAIGGISAAQYGSALILLISYGYVKMLGREGVTNSTRAAIFNANYIKTRLESHYDILYKGTSGTCAHEMILDCRDFKKTAKVEVEDIAKRLMDYGFHAPTVSFPVAGTLMVEPTESESKEELDRFCDAMIQIKNEINSIEKGEFDMENNPLKNAPHTATRLMDDSWESPYSRQVAAYPLPYIKEAKFWPTVGRVDNAHGDRNLICSCPSIEEYDLEMA